MSLNTIITKSNTDLNSDLNEFSADSMWQCEEISIIRKKVRAVQCSLQGEHFFDYKKPDYSKKYIDKIKEVVDSLGDKFQCVQMIMMNNDNKGKSERITASKEQFKDDNFVKMLYFFCKRRQAQNEPLTPDP